MRSKTCAIKSSRWSSSTSRTPSTNTSTSIRPLPSPVKDHNLDATERDSMDTIMSAEEISTDSDSDDGSRENNDIDMELYSCIKCNKGGDLLACKEKSCPVYLHSECIPSKPKYDEEGNFYCPYCWHKIHEIKADEWRKKALLAKQALRDFLGFKVVEVGDDAGKSEDVETGVGNSNGGQNKEDRNNSREHVERVNADGEAQDRTVEVEKDCQNGKNLTMSRPVGAGIDTRKHIDGKLDGGSSNVEPVVEERNSSGEDLSRMDIDGKVQNGTPEMKRGHQNGKNVNISEHVKIGGRAKLRDRKTNRGSLYVGQGVDGEARVETREVQNEGQKVNEQVAVEEELEHVNGHHPEEETDINGFVYGGAVADSEALNTSKGNLARKRKGDLHNDGLSEKLSERSTPPANASKQTSVSPAKVSKQTEDSIKSKESKQPEIPAKKLTDLSFPHEKRKRLNWSAEEEEMLREGVRKFSMEVNKNVPWRKILEYGRDTFDSSRMPSDLKDKWRKMVVRESADNGKSS